MRVQRECRHHNVIAGPGDVEGLCFVCRTPMLIAQGGKGESPEPKGAPPEFVSKEFLTALVEAHRKPMEPEAHGHPGEPS